MADHLELRPLADTGLSIAPIALGCWPMAGMTSPDVSDDQSAAALDVCFELGINHFDTAYCYGPAGESERLVGQAIRGRRDRAVVATKGGIEWGPGQQQVVDGSPATLHRHCRESLRRLEIDYVDLYYLHAPDPNTPLAESAGALRELRDAGLVRSVGLSNATAAQLEVFAAVCPLAAFQPPYNLLQRDIEADSLPWCRAHGVAVLVYWPLLKGLLAGKLARDHIFPPGDGRLKYPMYQGDEWQRNLDFVDELRAVAADAGRSVAQIALNWTIHQSGITAALCGAKRPDQVRDNAGAMGWRLTAPQLARIEAALAARGRAVTRRAVRP